MRVKTTFKRFKFDFYPTPPSCVSAIYTHLNTVEPNAFKGVKVLDAGAGTGIWGQVLKKKFPKNKYQLWGIDIQTMPKPDAYDYWITKTDFLSEYRHMLFTLGSFGLVVSNPPYKYGEEFVRKSLDLTRTGGYVIMLVRLAFLESIKRGTGLFEEYPPVRVSVLCRRPSFHLDKKTGSDAYMAITWQKGAHRTTAIDWLNWDYNSYWDGMREEAIEHLKNLGVLDEHLESKK